MSKLYCPQCGGEVIHLERRPDGNHICRTGHKYPGRLSRRACPRDNDGDGNCGNPTCISCRQTRHGLLNIFDEVPTRTPALSFYGDSSGLTFDVVQAAVAERGKAWGKGKPIPLLFNTTEAGGEVGELIEAFLHLAVHVGKIGNTAKKVYRNENDMAGGITREAAELAVREELGDAGVCLFIIANKLGLNLGEIVVEKFNKTSEKNNFPHRITYDKRDISPAEEYAMQQETESAALQNDWVERRFNLD